MINLDCKTVRIFAYSSTREQSNKRSWNEAEKRERDWGETLKIRACEARPLRARKTLTLRFTDFFSDFEKKPTFLQSMVNSIQRDQICSCKSLIKWSILIKLIKRSSSYFKSETVRNYRSALILTYTAGRINLLDHILKNLDQLKFPGTHLY